MKRLILMSFLLLALVCWQTSAVEKTKVNQVKSEMPVETGGAVLVAENNAVAVVAPVPPDSNSTEVTSTDVIVQPATQKGFWDLLAGYWAELLLGTMAVIKILVRITPTLKDDKVFGWLDKLIEMLLPNITTKKNG
jgi:hypothetical protein